MTGEEIKRALDDLDDQRRKKHRELTLQYDNEVIAPARKALIEQCPHEVESEWWRNGIGWSWKDCKFCGTRMESAPTDEVGGRLFGHY